MSDLQRLTLHAMLEPHCLDAKENPPPKCYE